MILWPRSDAERGELAVMIIRLGIGCTITAVAAIASIGVAALLNVCDIQVNYFHAAAGGSVFSLVLWLAVLLSWCIGDLLSAAKKEPS